MSEPRAFREALVAQLAGELDDLLRRVEVLTPAIANAGARLDASAAAVKVALERYEATVATLSAQTMKSIGEFAVRRTNEAVVKSVHAQEALIQRAARRAVAVELVPQLHALREAVARAAPQVTPSAWSTWLGHAATALLASAFTAVGVVVYLVRP